MRTPIELCHKLFIMYAREMSEEERDKLLEIIGPNEDLVRVLCRIRCGMFYYGFGPRGLGRFGINVEPPLKKSPQEAFQFAVNLVMEREGGSCQHSTA